MVAIADELNVLKVARVKCLQNFMFFTRYFFKKRFNRKFVIGDHHRQICDVLEQVYKGEITRLIINIAPRYGKTEIAVKNFIAAGLAKNPGAKFIHLSYSDDLALDNSEDTRAIVQSEAYQQLFPEVQIKHDSKGKKKWYTTDGGGVYATSSGGQVTGFGAGRVDEEDELNEFIPQNGKLFGGALVIDDPIKPEDADSELVRERINARYDSTISNRVNSRNTPIVIIMQRLHERDLCGYLIDTEASKWHVLSLPCINGDGSPLWEFKHTIEELHEIERRNPIVFERQYMQNAMPIQGRLYKTFKTYTDVPAGTKRRAVIDTADTGSDNLCCIVYDAGRVGLYVRDIYYTTDPMEITEGRTAKMLTEHDVADVRVESNNGGKSFARNVERIMREQNNYKTAVSWYHQSDNKQARIFTNAAEVQNMIHYPQDWEKRWPAFAKHVKSYMAVGKNLHDDAEDTLTMIIENEKRNKAETYIIRRR